jgi:XTP/dITP diphosphohydrolase
MSRTVLVIASHNRGKVDEFQAGLAGFGFEIKSLLDFPAIEEVEEDGDTFEANALIKAQAAFAATGYPSLADDSGLEVDALKGAPGIYSHRFAGPECDDAANNALLIKQLQGLPPECRRARFRSVLALVWGPDKELIVDGTCDGIILEAPQGSGGFGYDPLFYLPEFGRTMAEISLEEKNSISHRGRAIGKLREILQNRLRI